MLFTPNEESVVISWQENFIRKKATLEREKVLWSMRGEALTSCVHTKNNMRGRTPYRKQCWYRRSSVHGVCEDDTRGTGSRRGKSKGFLRGPNYGHECLVEWIIIPFGPFSRKSELGVLKPLHPPEVPRLLPVAGSATAPVTWVVSLRHRHTIHRAR